MDGKHTAVTKTRRMTKSCTFAMLVECLRAKADSQSSNHGMDITQFTYAVIKVGC